MTDEPSKLTGKQHAFVAAYLGEARMNATKAARIAGYAKPMQQGYENLRKPEIQAAIAEWREQVKTRAIASLEYRVDRLDNLEERYWNLIAARSDEYLTVPGGDTGLLVRQVKQVGAGPTAEIVEEYKADTAVTHEIRDLHKQAAQELGQWKDRAEVTGEDGAPLRIILERVEHGDGRPTG